MLLQLDYSDDQESVAIRQSWGEAIFAQAMIDGDNDFEESMYDCMVCGEFAGECECYSWGNGTDDSFI